MTRIRNWLAVSAVFGVLGMAVVGAQAAQASTLGKTTVGASDGGGLVANSKRVNAYRLTVPASVSKLDIYLSPSGTPGSQVMEGVIYADDDGSPGALVAQSTQVSFSSSGAAGWLDLPFASPVALSPGRYWLGIYTGATGAVAAYRFDAGTSTRARLANDQAYTLGGASDPFGAIGWHDNHVMSLYATYTTPAWVLQSLPAPAGTSGRLAGVSCASTTVCTAVGDQARSATRATLAERLNGTRWSIQTTPNPTGATDSRLAGVSCASAWACIAVGSYRNHAGTTVTLAERFNGESWSIQTTPNPAGATDSSLNGVSCTSAAACIAVGSYRNHAGATVTLAERFNGRTWSLQSSPTTGTFSVLNGVSCPSSAACTAVGSSSDGYADHALAERWNGTRWSIQATPDPSGAIDVSFDAVSCTSSTACTAVGGVSYGPQEQTLAERWNGTSWSLQRTPDTGDFSVLNGVSCPSGTACIAVGSSSLEGGPQVTLAERWNGTSWSIQATPNPKQGESSLGGVSCRTTSDCAAVGNSVASSVSEPLAERYW